MSQNSNDDYSFYLEMKEIANYISYTICIILFPTGFFLNVITIVLMKSKNFSNQSITFYYILISVNNNLILAFNFITFISASINNEATLWSNFSCVFFISSRIFTILASWLNIALTVDRIIQTYFPYKYFWIKKNKIKICISVCLFIASVLLSIPCFYFRITVTTSIDSVTNKTIITKVCTAPKNIIFIREIITFFLRGILPLIIILVMNSFLMYKLKRSKLYFLNNNELKKEYYFSYSIAAFNIFFIVLFLPYIGGLMMFFIVQNMPGVTAISRIYVIALFCYNIGVFSTTLTYCFAFLINFRFNVLFRHEFLSIYYKFKNYL